MSQELAIAPVVEDGQVQVWEDAPEELLGALGFENTTMDDVVVPRLSLAQALTPAISKSDELYIPGLSQGDFFDSISRKVYGPGVRVVPILFTKNRILFDKKSIDCRSEDGMTGGVHSDNCATCEYSKWGTGKDGRGTACTEFRNFIMYVPEVDDYAILSFKKSTQQTGKLFYTTVMSQKRMFKIDGKEQTLQLPIYGCEYMFRSVERTNEDGKFYVMGFDRVRDVTDRGLLKKLKSKHLEFKSVNIVASEEE